MTLAPTALRPTSSSERDPVLDALRGFAILGILLVNIEVMRGSDWLVLMAGDALDHPDWSDAIVQFAVGWLATGKFISSLAILFGMGAALISARALRSGGSVRAPLARRYVGLVAFGIAHMLLFPGDILFLYGLTGLALLAFVKLRTRTLMFVSIALLLAFGSVGVRYMGTFAASQTAAEERADSEPDSRDEETTDLRDQSMAAFSEGSFGDIVAAQASQALFLQSGQLLVLPWVLALFLFGFGAARAGLLTDLAGRRFLLRRIATIAIVIGVPANLATGFYGALAGLGARPMLDAPWLATWADIGQWIGAPVLAIGYMSALALRFSSHGAPRGLAAVGRMALTAYLMQSALALAIFGGLRLYDRLSSTSALLVVAAIWAVLLVFCPMWLRRFQFGPAEWVWRSLTYGRIQRLRREDG